MTKRPSFRVEQTLDKKRNAWVYQLEGNFVGSHECYEFLDDARDKIRIDAPHVVLLMSGVKVINSTGIGIIAALLTSAGENNGILFLVSPNDSALRQLKVSHLWELLIVADDLDQVSIKLEG